MAKCDTNSLKIKSWISIRSSKLEVISKELKLDLEEQFVFVCPYL